MSYQSAITTAYIGPTNFKGSRVKASAPQGSITISYDDALNSEGAHSKAAMTLANKLSQDFSKRHKVDPINSPWSGRWIGGDTVGNGYAFVRHAATNESEGLTDCGFIARG